MIAVSAITARPSEVALQRCLGDSRLVLLLPKLDLVTAQERDRIIHLPSSIFAMLGEFCGLGGPVLRGKCLQALCVQLGYAENRLRVARRLPWSLVSSDIDVVMRRLTEFKAGPLPQDLTAQKIHMLLTVPIPVERVASVVQLLGEVPFSTTIVEQGHSLASQLMKKTSAVHTGHLDSQDDDSWHEAGRLP
jgi:hypothetical protein